MIRWDFVKHFKPEEFNEPQKIDPSLIYLIDKIRDGYGCPIRINASYATTGHSPNSYHYKGLALDFVFLENKPDYLRQFIYLSRFLAIGGLGFYLDWHMPGWHIDLRKVRKRVMWFRRNGVYCYDYKYFVKALTGEL